MVMQPANTQEICGALAAASAQSVKAPAIDLSRLNRVVEYTPEDMTATVEAGMTLAAVQSQLGQRGQWLPVDSPHAERLTIDQLLSTNASGPRRFGYGTVRDYLIGLKVALADGRTIKSGGKVVKNVAGYDLAKLFIGSEGSLGVIVEATFKLRPLPEAEQFVQARFESLEEASTALDAVVESELAPVVLDWHNAASISGSQLSPSILVLGFAGTCEEVDWQVAKAGELNFSEPSNLEHESRFWSDASSSKLHRISVLPSRVAQAIADLGDVSFVARAGNGVIYYRRGPELPKEELPMKLMQRVKDAYDPKHILPEIAL